ncbi:MAG: hypothetical protein EGQ00_10655 [Parabacteroides johnsonii]|nr:hypothetical protein [Parabacteroides johnsonii]
MKKNNIRVYPTSLRKKLRENCNLSPLGRESDNKHCPYPQEETATSVLFRLSRSRFFVRYSIYSYPDCFIYI